jgi:hypothetical protein
VLLNNLETWLKTGFAIVVVVVANMPATAAVSKAIATIPCYNIWTVTAALTTTRVCASRHSNLKCNASSRATAGPALAIPVDPSFSNTPTTPASKMQRYKYMPQGTC